MGPTEIFLSFVPVVIAFSLALYLLNKMGAFDQRRHRRHVEALLERIAIAVEKQDKL